MFSLYFSKEDKELIIEPIKNNSWMKEKIIDGEVIQSNNYYFVSNDRKLLREKANEIKNNWISETEKELEMLKGMKVKNKYN